MSADNGSAEEHPQPRDPRDPRPPNEEVVRRAEVFWRQSRDDLKAARRALKGHEHLECSYLSFQAALNALTSVCYLQGRVQLPNFSTVQLAAICAEHDGRFAALEEPAGSLETVQRWDPFRTETAPEDAPALARENYRHGEAVLNTVRGYLKEHRRRFFRP